MGLLGTIAGFAIGGLQGGGAALSAASKKKGATKAAAALQGAADKNNALAGQVYQQNTNALAPYTQPGNPAGTQINALLGLGGPPGIGDGSGLTGTGAQTAGFDQFRNSTGYQFRLGEGMNALNSGYAGSGVLQSGAAMRGAQEYGQNFASNEFSNYAGLLDNQQRLGLSATMGQAGLGQQYVGTVSGNNMYAADGQANAALIRSQNNPYAALAGSLASSAQSFMSGGMKF